MNTIIHTERLIIRPFTHVDIEPSYQMNLDPEVSMFTGDGGVVSKQEVERRIREDVLGDYVKVGYGRMAICLKSNLEFIGFCGLKYLEDVSETDLGYRLKKEYWGQGLATEACRAVLDYGFNQLSLTKVIAFVMPANTASIRVLTKLGFEKTEEISVEEIPCFRYEKVRPE